MNLRNIHNSDGVWLVNKASFPFVDPETGARFEPGVPTQALKSAWVKSQKVIEDFVEPKKETEAATIKLAGKSAKD